MDEPMLRWFVFDHLPDHLQQALRPSRPSSL